MAQSSREFVQSLYRELLHRTPAENEVSYYAPRLDNGFLTRPQVAQTFLTATEYSAQIEAVARLYWAAFDRAPDYDGLLFWNSVVRNGARLDDVASIFSYAPEFASRYGERTSNEAFIKVLYQNALGRAPDANGEKYWLNVLANGAGRGQLLNAFAQSGELTAKLATQTKAIAAYALLAERAPTQLELESAPAGLEDLLLKATASAGALITWSAERLEEAPLNDGSISGSLIAKLSGDTFKGSSNSPLGTVANVPKGLTAKLIKISDTEAQLTLTGKATAHDAANSISNLTVNFTATDFASGKLPMEASRPDLGVDFIDMLLYVKGNTVSTTIRPTSPLTIDLTTDTARLGSIPLKPVSGDLANATHADFSGIVANTSATSKTSASKAATSQSILFKGGPETNQYRASPLGDQITGGGGNDVITLGEGADIVVMPATANGITTIEGFSAGAGRDVLKLSQFLGSTKTANLGVIDTNLGIPAAPRAWINGDVMTVIGSSHLSATDVAALFGTYIAQPSSARKAVLLTADVTGDTRIWYVTNSSGSDVTTITPAEIVHAGTLVGINNLELAGLLAGNFS